MSNQIWARKPVSMFEEDQKNSKLNKVLGKWGLTAMGIGAVIGAGIFVLTGLAAREYAGPALAVSFIIAGIGCAFAALCYAEFASLLPVEGSAYAYSYATMGEFFAWIIGWDLILEYAMASASVAVGWSGYLGKFLALFNIHLPLWLMHDHATVTRILNEATSKGVIGDLSNQYSSIDVPSFMGFNIAFNLPAFFIIMIVTAILVKGIKEAANTNLIMVAVKVAVILFVIIVGSFFIDTNNWVPFIPERYIDASGHGHYGWMGVLSGAAYVFFAYIGFDAVSTQAGEAKNPQKSVPFGIIVSLIVCTILYILVALVLTGMISYKEIDLEAPLSAVFASYNLGFAVFIISIAAIAGLTSVLLVMLLGQSRVFYAMSRDGLLPKSTFGELHNKFKTPYKATILTGVVVAFISALTPIEDIAKLVNIGTLLAFILVCIAVWIMRVKEPDRPRPFKTPYLPVVATLGILSNLAMMLSLELVNWLRLVAWLAIGCIIYFAYSKRHSLLGKRLKENKL
ncbi:MAG: amino acid permease [Bacteroidetes bacterium GWF2_29_10]|nr:MAG: amino acid permease [Bacteroidetes bacterium GWF2_29_10]